jgi:hypothetical protein
VLGWNLQTFPPPDALHSILAHRPARLVQQRHDTPIPVTTILTGQLEDRMSQKVFIIALCGYIALRSPGLADQPASLPFT